ncbi:hypothetical protein V6N13_087118 [Hibiscus sabdariffa]
MVASRGRSSIAEFVAVRLLPCHILAAPPSAVRWKFPPPAFLKVSVDMTLNAAGDRVGFGAVVRGSFMVSCSCGLKVCRCCVAWIMLAT